MTYFIEHRRTVQRSGPPKYVDIDRIEGLTGFRSLYAVTYADACRAQGERSVSVLADAPVFSDCLFVDYDGDNGRHEFAATLKDLGVEFSVWVTGRRGVHFHVPIVPSFGVTVPRDHLTWVAARATGDWDRTIYRPTAVIRLPGTWHEKAAGHCKECVERHEGALLEIPKAEQQPPGVRLAVSGGAKNQGEFWSALLESKGEPGRTFRLWHLARLSRECGIDEDEAVEALREWSVTRATPPLTDSREVERVIYNGLGGRR